ncbi:hypothetical protein PG984_016206 [Apiospora sp. TS-2023a]
MTPCLACETWIPADFWWLVTAWENSRSFPTYLRDANFTGGAGEEANAVLPRAQEEVGEVNPGWGHKR